MPSVQEPSGVRVLNPFKHVYICIYIHTNNIQENNIVSSHQGEYKA